MNPFSTKSAVYFYMKMTMMLGDVSSRKLSDISVPEIRILAPSMERGLDASPPPRRRTPSSLSANTTRPNNDDDDTSEHESAFSLQTTERWKTFKRILVLCIWFQDILKPVSQYNLRSILLAIWALIVSLLNLQF